MALVDSDYVPRSLSNVSPNPYAAQHRAAAANPYEPLALKDQPGRIQYERDRSALLRSPDANNNNKPYRSLSRPSNTTPVIPPLITVSSEKKDTLSDATNPYPRALRTPSPVQQPVVQSQLEKYDNAVSRYDMRPATGAPTHMHSDACYRRVSSCFSLTIEMTFFNRWTRLTTIAPTSAIVVHRRCTPSTAGTLHERQTTSTPTLSQRTSRRRFPSTPLVVIIPCVHTFHRSVHRAIRITHHGISILTTAIDGCLLSNSAFTTYIVSIRTAHAALQRPRAAAVVARRFAGAWFDRQSSIRAMQYCSFGTGAVALRWHSSQVRCWSTVCATYTLNTNRPASR